MEQIVAWPNSGLRWTFLATTNQDTNEGGPAGHLYTVVCGAVLTAHNAATKPEIDRTTHPISGILRYRSLSDRGLSRQHLGESRSVLTG